MNEAGEMVLEFKRWKSDGLKLASKSISEENGGAL